MKLDLSTSGPPGSSPGPAIAMAAFHVFFDPVRDIALCRIHRAIGLSLLSPFAGVLSAAVETARQRDRFRLLWDARAGRFISMEAMEIARSVVGRNACPTDRIAILVPDAMDRRALLSVTDSSRLFEDEGEAVAWLHA